VNPTILVVDDDPNLCDLVSHHVRNAGCDVRVAHHAEDALADLGAHRVDLILLDWILPGMSGLELVRLLRRRRTDRNSPIIMLSARTEEADKLLAFELGVDDYITKPFQAAELMARIGAVLRGKSAAQQTDTVEIDNLRLIGETMEVQVGEAVIKLLPTEFRLLFTMAKNVGVTFSRTRLLHLVWGTRVRVHERTIDVHVRRLRMALKQCEMDECLDTVIGVGYRFRRPSECAGARPASHNHHATAVPL
jgi:two-component system, OmpR family, phosphate regulon response regulator PhoB